MNDVSIVDYPAVVHDLRLTNGTEDSIGTCTVIFVGEGQAFLESILIAQPYQGRGYGSLLLAHIVKLYGHLELSLVAGSYGPAPLSDADLMSWYRRYGFVSDQPPNRMIRPPNPQLD